MEVTNYQELLLLLQLLTLLLLLLLLRLLLLLLLLLCCGPTSNLRSENQSLQCLSTSEEALVRASELIYLRLRIGDQTQPFDATLLFYVGSASASETKQCGLQSLRSRRCDCSPIEHGSPPIVGIAPSVASATLGRSSLRCRLMKKNKSLMSPLCTEMPSSVSSCSRLDLNVLDSASKCVDVSRGVQSLNYHFLGQRWLCFLLLMTPMN